MATIQAKRTDWQPIYAGFWPRLLAFGLDYLIIAIYLIVMVATGFTVQRAFPAVQQALFSNPVSAELTGFLLLTLPVTLYFALMESSPRWQATWGKHRMGLIVAGRGGVRISRGKSLLRSLIKFVPWELAHFTIWQFAFTSDSSSPFLNGCLILVWLLVGANLVSLFVSPTRQALYDRLAGTWVLRKSNPTKTAHLGR